ncbi:MAG: GNAT family N-acetyltransferase [Proteobacteria bacterium]|nr:GNAT family N-acetyltransferase [Pseudomonadota bacterium]
MSNPKVERLAYPPDDSSTIKTQWNALVSSLHGDYNLLFEWMSICSLSQNLEPHPLYITENNALVSLCPLVFNPVTKELRIPPTHGLGGSLPLSDMALYLPEISKISKELGAKKTTIQIPAQEEATKVLKRFGYNTDDKMPYYVLDLEGVKSFLEAKKKFSKGAKRGINLSKRNGVTVKSPTPSPENLTLAYNIYLETMSHNKAAHLLPLELFKAIGEFLPGDTKIFLAEREGKLIGATICFDVGETFTLWTIFALIEERKAFVNNALYCAVIDYAVSNGLRYVDFGPSGPLSKAREIKKKHGGSERWMLTAVRINNPLKSASYTIRKLIRRKAIESPNSLISKLYKRFALK